MYKNIPADLKVIKLDNELFDLHKKEEVKSEFGMDNTAELLEGGFGLYSSVNVKGNIGPAKTQYFRISLTRGGSACFDIGLEGFQTKRNSILFGIPGQVFSLHDVSEDFLAYYMLFSEGFVADTFLTGNRKQYFPFLTYSGLQCFELDEATAAEIESLIFKMNEEVRGRRGDCTEVIRLYIQLILIHANRCYGNVLLGGYGSGNALESLYHSYLKLVGQHFLSVRKVGEYARMLHVSPDYLNRAIRAYSDRTAHGLIDDMLLMEAKAYLLHSKFSVSEIAYKLEFTDPSHFNRFFRKLCGQTPLEFRNRS